MAQYVVVRGDTLSKIAARYGTTWQELARVNAATIPNPDLIYPDQTIEVPPYGAAPTATGSGVVTSGADAGGSNLPVVIGLLGLVALAKWKKLF